MPESLDDIIARFDAEDAACAEFASANLGRTFEARPRPTTGLTRVIVSPSCDRRGGWRLTRFDRRGPWGHTEFATYGEAVREAVLEYGADLGAAVFAG